MVELLLSDPLRYADLLLCLQRGSAEVLVDDADGVLIYERIGQAYMLACRDGAAGRRLVDALPDGAELLTLHDVDVARYAAAKLGLGVGGVCHQFVYHSAEPLPEAEGLDIRRLDESFVEVVSAHYKLIPDPVYIRAVLSDGLLWGCFVDGQLVGFAGYHHEGSMGLLQIFEHHRGKGYAVALQSFLINRRLAEGLVPYGQVFVDNVASLGLQEKLGMTRAAGEVVWVY